jgi:glycosyltransferase involved in cell wall biosynthesis
LQELYRRVTAICRQSVGGEYEILLINNGSSDGTLAVMAVLAETDPHVVVISLTRNYGHQAALTAGLEHCRGDRVLIIDADLQ